ncbi:hypothetical protein OSC27_10015 [Microbacterium sp. STN6]|uniref:hypothetical protein n=1 Tax=Microbacterium sp. STN6 TaxID=2995588 RepID=UPI002260DA63|nr:hypothetical protein [Microbacterium sp. STN6]MCX7522609.1 hypothetical protein [Microbacterium sp. STN6]
MNWYDPFIVAFLGACFSFAASPFRYRRTARGRLAALDRTARRVDLTLHPSVNGRVMRRLVLRDRALLIGGLSATTFAAAAYPAVQHEPGRTWPWIGLYALVSASVGGAIGLTLSRAFRIGPATDSPRYARAHVPSLSDYVTPGLLWAVRALPAAAILGWAALLVAATLGGHPHAAQPLFDPTLLLVLIAAPLSLLGSAAAQRSILRRGQQASSPLELAWDDALRAESLRDVLSGPFVLGFLALAGVALTVGRMPTALGEVTSDWTSSIVMGFLVAGAVVFAIAVSTETRYWRRLWAETGSRHEPSAAGAHS